MAKQDSSRSDLQRNLDSLREGITCEQTPYNCSVKKGCDFFYGLQAQMVESFGRATTEAAIIAGEKEAEKNGTCRAYEIYKSWGRAIGTAKAREIFGRRVEGIKSLCKYENIALWKTYADQAEDVVDGLFTAAGETDDLNNFI